MTSKSIDIKFDKKTALAVKESLVNSYGFDLSDENAIGYTTGKFRFTILGFRPIAQYDTLIATVKVSLIPHVHDEYTNVQKLNLYDADRLTGYARASAFQLQCTLEEIKAGLYSLRERLERYRLDEIRNGQTTTKKTILSSQVKRQAMEILKADNVMDSIEGLLKQAGLVTEVENGLRLFLILLSRNFDSPLHALLQGSSQLSRLLMETVVSTLPEDQVRTMTSASASTMYYNRNKEYWKNKVLFATSIDKYFKGASTIKEFLENKILKRHTTESDQVTRQLYSSEKIIAGPICLLGFSEDERVNSKFFQECFFIRVEENEKNKSELLNYNKKEFAGLVDISAKEEAKELLKAIQQLVEPIKVIVPFAESLTLPLSIFHQLRSFNQLIAFVKAVALLHQFTLKKKKEKSGEQYIEATIEHLEIALELFKDIAIAKSDILSAGQRSFFEKLKTEVKEKDSCFKIPAVLKAMRMKKSSFYKEFEELKEQGFIIIVGGNKKDGIDYKITDWDDYKGIQDGMSILQEQLKSLKAEDSTKFPRSFHQDSTDKKGAET